ncbi:MAG: hypothetical protein WBI53_03575 [Paludibacter sp.]
MKKNLKLKYLSIFLGLLFLFNAFPINVLAEVVLNSTDISPLEVKDSAVTKLGTTTIINNSNNKYFIPNKTYFEIDSFAKNAPNYALSIRLTAQSGRTVLFSRGSKAGCRSSDSGN